jgi:hypothetical protein
VLSLPVAAVVALSVAVGAKRARSIDISCASLCPDGFSDRVSDGRKGLFNNISNERQKAGTLARLARSNRPRPQLVWRCIDKHQLKRRVVEFGGQGLLCCIGVPRDTTDFGTPSECRGGCGTERTLPIENVGGLVRCRRVATFIG